MSAHQVALSALALSLLLPALGLFRARRARASATAMVLAALVLALGVGWLAAGDESAAELILRLSREHNGSLEIITIGPTTNIALALRLDPHLAERVSQVTVMGGVALAPGNIGPVSEANVHNDPEAASILISAPWPVTLVPLDVTLENTLEEEDRDALLTASEPLTRAVGEILDHYYDFYVGLYGRRSSALHDPLAAAIAVGGVTATVAPAVNVVVDTTDGPGRGQTICDLRGQRLGARDMDDATARVVLDTDQPLAPHLVARLTAAGAYSRTL